MLLRNKYAGRSHILENTTITVGSVTYAMKARRLLLHAGIRAKTVRILPEGKRGCNHALIIPSSRFFDAVVILKENAIPYSLHEGGM